MLTAKIGESIVNVFDSKFDKSKLKTYSSKGIIKCPVCEGEYEYCHGEIVMPYFRHKSKECEFHYSEPETEEHMMGKKLLYEWIKEQPDVVNCKLEAWIPETKQRPDIYFEQNGIRYVIEYQCTPISSEHIKRRELYELAGIKDIWILGMDKYKFESNPRKHIQKNVYSHKNQPSHFDVTNSEFILSNKFPVEMGLIRQTPYNQYELKVNLDNFKFVEGKFEFINVPIKIQEAVKLNEFYKNHKISETSTYYFRTKRRETKMQILKWQIEKYNSNKNNKIEILFKANDNYFMKCGLGKNLQHIFYVKILIDSVKIEGCGKELIINTFNTKQIIDHMVKTSRKVGVK